MAGALNAGPPLDGGRLHTFTVVARERGFSRAARALGRTQSSVSQAVALLEQELGETLFVRGRRQVTLTDAGRLLLGHAQRVLAEMARARAQLQAARALEAGELDIGASDTLACYLLPPVLAAFRQRFPRVELRLSNQPSPATAAAVAARRLHVGVVSLPLPPGVPAGPGAVHVEPLVRQTDVVITPPGHPLARRRRIPLAALAPHPLLLLDRSTASRAHLEAAFSRLARRPAVVMEMSSVEVLKRLCQLGFGLSVVPGWAVRREVAAGELAARPLAGVPGPRRVGLVLPADDPDGDGAGSPPSPAAAAFATLARERLRERVR
jgi:DNA-binding transcriptional LysR family regulator